VDQTARDQSPSGCADPQGVSAARVQPLQDQPPLIMMNNDLILKIDLAGVNNVDKWSQHMMQAGIGQAM